MPNLILGYKNNILDFFLSDLGGLEFIDKLVETNHCFREHTYNLLFNNY